MPDDLETARLEAAREEGRRKLAADAPRAAVIYCRMSLTSMGDTTKVEEQERICRALGDQLGWPVVGVYSDNNRSAWKKNKRRPKWEEMLAEIEAGRADAIINYHGDRLVRQPRDLEKLIDLAEGKGIRLASPTGTRNLDRRDDRVMVRVIAAFAEDESAANSERKKAQHERMRRAGLVRSGGRGGRAFGFETDGITHIPEETAIVREVAGGILTGEGIRTIATSLAAQGVTTTAGKAMHPIAIRRMIANPRYAGLMPDGEQAGAWEPVLSRQDWETAQLIMGARNGPMPPGHTARRHLLSGIAECGVCGAGMQALPAYTYKEKSRRAGQRVAATYGCIKPGCRKVTRDLALLDAYVSRRTVNRLANPANPSGVPSHPDFGREFQQLATERAAVEEQVRDYQASPGRVGLLMARLDSIDARLAELRELAADDTRTRILEAHAGITAEAFAGLPLATRRALISACYRVTVLPASKRGPGFKDEDVQLVPR